MTAFTVNDFNIFLLASFASVIAVLIGVAFWYLSFVSEYPSLETWRASDARPPFFSERVDDR